MYKRQCKIRYLGRPDDVGNIDGLLAAAISARLAADSAYTLVQSNALMQSMWSLYQQKMEEARIVDQVESSRDYWINTQLEQVRSGISTAGIRYGRAWW